MHLKQKNKNEKNYHHTVIQQKIQKRNKIVLLSNYLESITHITHFKLKQDHIRSVTCL